jgi:hypothetical protein
MLLRACREILILSTGRRRSEHASAQQAALSLDANSSESWAIAALQRPHPDHLLWIPTLQEEDFRGNLLIIEPKGIRIRRAKPISR